MRKNSNVKAAKALPQSISFRSGSAAELDPPGRNNSTGVLRSSNFCEPSGGAGPAQVQGCGRVRAACPWT